eukprot:7933105-Pyramimonas_sp.AAC.1
MNIQIPSATTQRTSLAPARQNSSALSTVGRDRRQRQRRGAVSDIPRRPITPERRPMEFATQRRPRP